MAITYLRANTEELSSLRTELQDNGLTAITDARAEIGDLLAQLTEADWRNHDSRRFIRHYKKLDARLDSDLQALKTCIEHLDDAIAAYTALGGDVERYFSTSFWKQS